MSTALPRILWKGTRDEAFEHVATLSPFDLVRSVLYGPGLTAEAARIKYEAVKDMDILFEINDLQDAIQEILDQI